MNASADRFWPPPQTAEFEIEFRDGSRRGVQALGLAVDGDDLLFFSRWSESGKPLGNRVPRQRVKAVVTRAVS